MRLFQNTSVALEEMDFPPPFLRHPTMEVAKNMSSFNAYRDHKLRLPTPEKTAIMDLSNSYERRRLGRQQQLLIDMNQRCREQEISDMSSSLTAKCELKPFEIKRTRETTFYSYPNIINRRERMMAPAATDKSSTAPSAIAAFLSPRKTTTPREQENRHRYFPARRVIKPPQKMFNEFTKAPQINRSPTMVQDGSATKLKSSSSNNSRTNKLEGMLGLKQDTAYPLLLPTIPINKVDALTTSRVHLLGKRTKTMVHGFSGNHKVKSEARADAHEPVKSERLHLVKKITNLENDDDNNNDQVPSSAPVTMRYAKETDVKLMEENNVKDNLGDTGAPVTAGPE